MIRCTAINTTNGKRCSRDATGATVWPREYRVHCTQHERFIASGHPFHVSLALNPDNEVMLRTTYPGDLTRRAQDRAARDAERALRPAPDPAFVAAMLRPTPAGAYRVNND